MLIFAPGEGQHQLSLYHYKDAEYFCFPSIFCGERRPGKEDRSVHVHYSDIVKWELRSVDRRTAQSVPNIFFKHKKDTDEIDQRQSEQQYEDVRIKARKLQQLKLEIPNI